MGKRQSSKKKTKKLDDNDLKDNPKVSKFVVHEFVRDEVYHAGSRSKDK